MRASSASALAFAVAVTTLAASARAQSTAPSIDARTWRPSTDPAAGLVLEPTTTTGAWNWSVGAWTNYAYRSVTLDDPSTGARLRPVKHFLGLDLVAGLGVGHGVSFGLSLPTASTRRGPRRSPRRSRRAVKRRRRPSATSACTARRRSSTPAKGASASRAS